MNLKHKTLLTPNELAIVQPISPLQRQFIDRQRSDIGNILNDQDERILLVVGPCSIHDIDSATEYANRLKSLSDQVSTRFLIVMRVYFEKPRTKADWKGFLYDPKLDGSNDIEFGLKSSRKFLLYLADLGLPVATEFLDPAVSNYIADLVSLGTIGSRTVKSQIHRQLASSLPMPVGFKNPLSGAVQVAIDAAEVAARPHSFLGINDDGVVSIVESDGNPLPCIILRGSRHEINYDEKSIVEVAKKLKNTNINQRLLIDCAHGNRLFGQEKAFHSVIKQINDGEKLIAGIFLESNLFDGRQSLQQSLDYGISITDHCIGFDSIEKLIKNYM